MKIKPSIQSFLLLGFSVVLLFVGNAVSAASSHRPPVSELTLIQTDTGGGQVVRLDLVQTCIAKYDSVMAAHGFSSSPGQPVDLHITSTAMITNSETFNGKKLQDWITTTSKAYAKAGKIFMIKIQLGIYDLNYLNVYEPDPSLRALYNNRIAVFLIPIDSSTGQTFQSADMQPAAGGGGSGTGTGFDFGGLEP